MDKKQGFMAITMFSFSLLVLTLPIWLDSSMPYIQTYYSSVIGMFQQVVPSLNLITTEVINAVHKTI
jgi:hypothetical protein